VRFLLGLLLLTATPAHADPVVLRMATQAPSGTAWAREINQFSQKITSDSGGRVLFKWYWGGITGDELAVLDRIRRGQLDGEGGSMFCEKLAPSMRVTRILGLYVNRDESHFVLNRLRPQLEQEFHRSGFELIGLANLGSVYAMSRRPIQSFADLKRDKYWVWNLDELVADSLHEMGIHTMRTPPGDARRAYEDGALDGFLSSPVGALAFQWSSVARYYLNLPIGMLPGCVVVAQRALDPLPRELQELIRREGVRLQLNLEKQTAMDDDNLLGVLFEKQGMKRLEPDARFRAEFFEAAGAARERLGARLVQPALLRQVLSWLADFRSEHKGRRQVHSRR
jgi:TRAP-type C4-dicarboxylate transport system substrate-binding protein